MIEAQSRKSRAHGSGSLGGFTELDFDRESTSTIDEEKVDFRSSVSRPEIGVYRLDAPESLFEREPLP
jgi:hypothetical protein